VLCTGVAFSELVYLPRDLGELLTLSRVIQIKAVERGSSVVGDGGVEVARKTDFISLIWNLLGGSLTAKVKMYYRRFGRIRCFRFQGRKIYGERCYSYVNKGYFRLLLPTPEH
jgi:hypothetical protein